MYRRVHKEERKIRNGKVLVFMERKTDGGLKSRSDPIKDRKVSDKILKKCFLESRILYFSVVLLILSFTNPSRPFQCHIQQENEVSLQTRGFPS